MEFDLSTWAFLIPAVMIAGISKGGFGASVGFLATPLMALVISPVLAAAIMLPILIMIDHANLITYWKKWSWASVWPAAAAALIGITVGGFAFGKVDPNWLRLGLGSIAILFTLFLWARTRGWAPQSTGPRGVRAGVWGSITGFTSTIAHAGGPPVTMYLLDEKLPKTTYQASTVLLFWWINLVKLIPYGMAGAIDLSSLVISVKLIPAAIVGVLLGVWLHKRAPEKLFFQAMIVFLFIIGCKLIWDGWSGLQV